MRAREVRASVVNKASLQFNQTPSWLCRCHKAFTRCSPWSSYAASYALTIHVDRPEHSVRVSFYHAPSGDRLVGSMGTVPSDSVPSDIITVSWRWRSRSKLNLGGSRTQLKSAPKQLPRCPGGRCA